MKRQFTIGELTANPGEKKSGWLYVGDRPASKYAIPLSIINGSKDGPILSIIAGQHGTEYVGIGAAIETIRKTDPKSISGLLLVVPVVNVLGFEQRSRLAFPLEDDFNGTRNLNRLWPGQANGSLAHLTIYTVFEKVVKNSQYLIDLHGGDVYENLVPCTMITRIGNQKIDEVSRTMAELIGYDYIIESSIGTESRGRSKTEAALIGIPTVVVETGDQGKYDSELVQKAFQGVQNIMKYLKMIQGSVSPKKDCRTVYDMVKVRAKIGGLFIQSVAVGSLVRKGDKLGEIISIHGDSEEEVTANESGVLIESFCNPAVNTGEILAEIALLR
jgi:predicted deacylase